MRARILSWIKKHRGVILIFGIGLAWRIWLMPTVFHLDLWTQAAWGQWMYLNGYSGLYSYGKWLYEWPNQAPFSELSYGLSYPIQSWLAQLFANIGVFIAIHRLAPTYFRWWFDFTSWFGSTSYPPTTLLIGVMWIIKAYAVVADMLVSVVVYLVAKSAKAKQPLLFPALYLFLPFGWYLSAIWGQTDQLVFLFVVLAFLALRGRWILVAPILLVTAANFKPTALLFLPLFCWVAWVNRSRIWAFLAGWVVALAMFVASAALFSSVNLSKFIFDDLVRILFLTKTQFIVVSALNFWRIWFEKRELLDSTILGFWPAKTWGVVLFGICYLIALMSYRRNSPKRMFTSMFIVGMGGWMFLTNMYERYIFSGFMSALFLAIYDRRILKYWVGLSLVLVINFYYGWWYPEQLNWFKDFLTWQNGLVLRGLAVINLVIFIRIICLEWWAKNETL